MRNESGWIGLLLFPAFILSACASVTEDQMGESTPKIMINDNSLQTLQPTPEEKDFSETQADIPPFGAKSEFVTDFSKHSVPYSEILSGGPPKDGIPALDNPKTISIQEADQWLKAVEPVIYVEINNEARAYPIQILMWHEIVNDTLGGIPVSVTFCPLCTTAIVYDREINGILMDFGTTGRLRYSNMIMYDRQSESWWQQATGEAIVGDLLGEKLTILPGTIISWQDFKDSYPLGTVLSRETGYNKNYGGNPYSGYDDVNKPPFLYAGSETPDVLPPVARVLTVDINKEAVAYPYGILEKIKVINDRVGDEEIVVIWKGGTASSLDTSQIIEGRDIGSANAFSRLLDNRTLTFMLQNDEIVDQQTGTSWNVLGLGVKGELEGQKLTPVVAINHFWFSWAAFRPETRVFQP